MSHQWDIVVDPYHRRAWSTSLSNPNLAEVDIDSGKLVDVHAIAWKSLLYPAIELARDGRLWVANRGRPVVTCYDPFLRQELRFDGELSMARSLSQLPQGGVLVAGCDAAESSVLQIFTNDGPGEPIAWDSFGVGMVPLWGDRVGLLQGREMVVLALPVTHRA